MILGDPLMGFGDGSTLARAIVDTVREPILVLDQHLRVIAASRSFYVTFRVNRQDTLGRSLYALGEGHWDIPALRLLLEKIVPERAEMEGYEVAHAFPDIGQRIMLLNARQVFSETKDDTAILLAIEDVTERRAAERNIQDLLRQKELLLAEMQHRIANSLQIIASILLLKASSVQSEETKRHLTEAHARVLSVASVQEHLSDGGRGETLKVGPYLTKLCASLTQSMIGERSNLKLEVHCTDSDIISSDAVSIGLIVTEGVINAIKHAFPEDKSGSRVVVSYTASGTNWKLAIADNGVGKPSDAMEPPGKSGLGTNIVTALAQQLAATAGIVSGALGTTLSVVHGDPISGDPEAA